MKSILASIASLALAAAATFAQSEKTSAPSKSAEVEIYEAVIRYQIKSWTLAADSFCIEINGRDAEKTILDDLQSFRVKPKSACQERVKKSIDWMQVVDRKTKKRSVFFDLESIRVKNDTEAEIDGGYECASLCLAGGVYYATHDASGWHVIRFDPHLMS